MTTGPSQAQAGGSSHQLSVGTPHSAAGPSPHTLRRGKWPALLVLGEGVRTSYRYSKESVMKALRNLCHDCYQIISRQISIKTKKHQKKLKKKKNREKKAGTVKLSIRKKALQSHSWISRDLVSQAVLCLGTTAASLLLTLVSQSFRAKGFLVLE